MSDKTTIPVAGATTFTENPCTALVASEIYFTMDPHTMEDGFFYPKFAEALPKEAVEAIKAAVPFAICPLDGRYAEDGELKFTPYFSEYALFKYRIRVEIAWLIFFLKNVNLPDGEIDLTDEDITALKDIYEGYDMESYKRIKEIEAKTRHDVKSVELYIGEQLDKRGYGRLKCYVHIGRTSEDINNTSYALMIKEALFETWLPQAGELIDQLSNMARMYASTPMMGHTHGQPATPTTVGKELGVYVYRLKESVAKLTSARIYAKLNGATGTYAADKIAYPLEDWPELSKRFIKEYIGADFNPVTTQIESQDWMCRIFNEVKQFSGILKDFCIDSWLLISMEYYNQKTVATEVGSSVMPHKVNPIMFENAESNCDLCISFCEGLSRKLAQSRLQRDLSNSSALRNIGMIFGYAYQAISQAMKGCNRISPNEEKLNADLENNYAILAEAVQTCLRKYGNPDAYNQLKELTRGKAITKEIMHEFIESLEGIPEYEKNRLLELKPSTYLGYAKDIAIKPTVLEVYDF